MVVGFCSIGDWCYSEWCVGFENTCTVPGKWNVFRVISRLYGWVCKTLRRNPLVFEHKVVVITAGSYQGNPKFNPMGSQF